MNHLMPRVRQMMLNAAQFINATKPESQLSYLNKAEETVWFKNEGYKLLLADYQIYAMSRADIKATIEKLRQIAMQNNTAGGSLYDIAQVMTTNSPAKIIEQLKKADDARNEQAQSQQQNEQQMQQQQQQFLADQQEKKQQHDDYWRQKEIQRDIYVAEIKAMGYAKDTDVNQDSVPDALEVDKFLHEVGQDGQDINLKERQMQLQERQHADNINIQKKKIDAEKYKVDKQKEIEAMKVRNKPKSK